MPPRTDTVDLGSLGLAPGEGRRMALEVSLGEVTLAGEQYGTAPARVRVTLDVSRMTGRGWSLRLRLRAGLRGPCMRCLELATPEVSVDAREIDQPDSGEELDSPYVERDELDLSAWAHDALVLALPTRVLCREDCAGLCPICAENLNAAGPEHHHEREPDPRWAKLRELRLE